MGFSRSVIVSKDEGHRIAFGDEERKFQLWERPGRELGEHDFRLKLGKKTLGDFSTKEAPDASVQDVFIGAMDKLASVMHDKVEAVNDLYEYGTVTQEDLDRRSEAEDAIYHSRTLKYALNKDKERGFGSTEEEWEQEFSDAVNGMSGKDPAPPEK